MSPTSAKSGSKVLALACILLLVCQIASATRTFAPKDGVRNASIVMEKNPEWQPNTDSKTARLAKMYLKTKRRMPLKLQLAWEKEKADGGVHSGLGSRDVGGVTNSTAGFYVFPITIGTPSKTFNVVFDTGSVDLWTWGWQLPEVSNISLAGHNYYNATESLTSEALSGESLYACYGAGCVLGNMGYDTVAVDSLWVYGNPVPWILWEDIQTYDYPGIDGILGLALGYNDSESPDPQQSWPAFVLPLLSPLEGFTTSFYANGAGVVDFGSIDEKKYTGDLTYTPVTETFAGWDYWAFTWDGFALSSGTYNVTSFPVITDTGGPTCSFPPSIVEQWQKAVPGGFIDDYGDFIIPCTATLPDFTFGIGNAFFTIPGSLFNGGWAADDDQGNGWCWSTFYPGDEEFVYLGIPLFQSLFVVHDYGNRQMGFANQSNSVT